MKIQSQHWWEQKAKNEQKRGKTYIIRFNVGERIESSLESERRIERDTSPVSVLPSPQPSSPSLRTSKMSPSSRVSSSEEAAS